MIFRRSIVVLSACIVSSFPQVQAADLQGHSARYRLEQATNTPKDVRITGSLSTELRRTCTGFETSWAAAYSVERARKPVQFEEALSTQETADGLGLEYTSRYRVDGRTTTGEGKARFGKNGEAGTLAVKPTNLAPDSRIQPGALPPVAFRSRVIDLLLKGERGPWIVPGMEMIRFHRSTDYRIMSAEGAVAPPSPPTAQGVGTARPDPKPSGMPVAPAPGKGVANPPPIDLAGLAKARSATLKFASYQITDFADFFMQLHVNGVASRMSFRRDGYDVVASLVEANAFPNPKCN